MEHEQNYLLSLTEPEYTKVLKLLQNDLATDNDVDESEQTTDLINKLAAAKSSTVLTNMMFINVYTAEQHYGGPEEGGWYYHTQECTECCGFLVIPGNAASLSYLVDAFFELSQNCDIHDQFHLSYGEVIDCLTQSQYYSVFDTDAHGEGQIIAIEPAPAMSEDLHTPHYC